jgi:hypothetical protein
MAQAEHLPIYKASYDLCLYLERVTRNFSRAHKYTLGADLRDGTRRVLKLIVRANARYDKVPLLLEVREEIEALKVVVRLCQDVKRFPASAPSSRPSGRSWRSPSRTKAG